MSKPCQYHQIGTAVCIYCKMHDYDWKHVGKVLQEWVCKIYFRGQLDIFIDLIQYEFFFKHCRNQE
jgi:hypothetical protein